MKKLLISLCLITISVNAKSFYLGALIPNNAKQLVVIEGGLNKFKATLTGYTRIAYDSWQQSFSSIPVVLGSDGIARLGAKEDYDYKTPSGLFSLGSVYGYFPNQAVKYRYWEIDQGQMWLENSELERESNLGFNQESKATTIFSEGGTTLEPKLKKRVNRYNVARFGVVVNYNQGIYKDNRQAIFLYTWKTPKYGSDGSISMSNQNMHKFIRWLNNKNRPYLLIDYTITR